MVSVGLELAKPLESVECMVDISTKGRTLSRTTWLEGNLCFDNITCKGHLVYKMETTI